MQMIPTITKLRRCPACRLTELVPDTYLRDFHPHGKVVAVTLLTSRCSSCGAEATSAAQHAENLARLKARKADYGGLLLGEEILALRRRYGITQQNAAKIFGKGKIAFSRYENETSYPDESTTRLLTLAIEKLDVIRWLADRADVELPLWDARCEDERRDKLRVVADVRKVDAEASSWAKPAMDRRSPHAMLSKWVGNALTLPIEATKANDEDYAMDAVEYA
jgi:putative zinc finger/helix-turn-helix YgiT family protein